MESTPQINDPVWQKLKWFTGAESDRQMGDVVREIIDWVALNWAEFQALRNGQDRSRPQESQSVTLFETQASVPDPAVGPPGA